MLLLLDIDHSKAVSDSHGHAADDLVLKACPRPCSSACAPWTVARIGGGSSPSCCRTAPRLRSDGDRAFTRASKRPVAIGLHQQISVTVSLGGAFAPQWVRSSALLWVERADQQLYRAKSEGRNRACLEQPAVSLVSPEEKGLLFGTSQFQDFA